MATYRPIDLARMFQIHQNTVKFYEKVGYISSAEREANNYRSYTDIHVMQLQICRYIFGHPFTNRHIRNTGNHVIKASVDQNPIQGLQWTEDYISAIQDEIVKAKITSDVLRDWIHHSNATICSKRYSRKEVASMLGVTKETVRNWERNVLVTSKEVGEKNEKLFSEFDVERMRIIYMLLQTGYSISAIYRCMAEFDQGNCDNMLININEPNQEDILSVGDNWLNELLKLETDAKKIPPIFEEMKKII